MYCSSKHFVSQTCRYTGIPFFDVSGMGLIARYPREIHTQPELPLGSIAERWECNWVEVGVGEGDHGSGSTRHSPSPGHEPESWERQSPLDQQTFKRTRDRTMYRNRIAWLVSREESDRRSDNFLNP